MRRSRFYKPVHLGKEIIKCEICERGCILGDGVKGFCGIHINRGGVLYDLGYGILSAIEPRPIEIKPLFHYYPNSWALTFSGWSCNFKCPWCQNYILSTNLPGGKENYVLPEELIEKALKLKQHGLCASFNEPTIHADYLVDVGLEASKYGLYLTIVTNGSMTLRVLKELLDAGYTGFSIDIKGCPETYSKYFGVNADIVYRNAKYVLDNSGHVEMVYLVIPGVNDHRECYEWIINKHVDTLGLDIPLHINRYYPAYKFTKPPTPVEKLLEIREYALKQGLEYVYVGNILDESYQDTYCPRCGKLLISRRRYRVFYWKLEGDKCPRCGYKIRIFGEYKP